MIKDILFINSHKILSKDKVCCAMMDIQTYAMMLRKPGQSQNVNK